MIVAASASTETGFALRASRGLVSDSSEEAVFLDLAAFCFSAPPAVGLAASDLLLLSVDEEEQRKLKSTCEACVAARKPFNLKDVMLMYVPFVSPEEISVFEAETLNNTQAVVLILRECLNPTNPLTTHRFDAP